MTDFPVSPTLLRVVRVFRIGRILRLIRVISNLNLSLTINEWESLYIVHLNSINSIATSSELFLRSCYFRLRREFGSYFSRWLSPCRHFSISEPCWRSSLLSMQLSVWRSSATWSIRGQWMIWSTLRPSADQCSFCSGLWKKVLSKFYWLSYESEARVISQTASRPLIRAQEEISLATHKYFIRPRLAATILRHLTIWKINQHLFFRRGQPKIKPS